MHGGAGSSGFLLLSCQVSKHEGPRVTEVAGPGGARGASAANDQEQVGVGPGCPFLYLVFSITSAHYFI